MAHMDMPEEWASKCNVGIIAQTSEVIFGDFWKRGVERGGVAKYLYRCDI